MSTGLSSVANLQELGAAYPFAGMEYVFAIGLLAFFALFFFWQVAMEQLHINKIMGEAKAEATAPMGTEPDLAAAE